MIGDLVEFLSARLDEDDEAARDAAGWDPTGSSRAAGLWRRDGINSVIDSSDRLVIYGDGPAPTDAQAEHIARHDPARVLREVEAKRRILAYHRRPNESSWPQHCIGCGYAGPCDDPITEDINDCPMLGDLAAVYSGHPDYQTRWKP